ncbi:uncharacterized protein At4g15970 isoform X2 [Diospyros lotus]|uniref:uncharacterized protein At4g15970 isoform X2 n=1 Tax=Diospyros lotus TaxID=55363 RepID=UPI00224DD2E7|nr:uncharacterized protein At4g15970 isoform X2 [Diospyros lotus]
MVSNSVPPGHGPHAFHRRRSPAPTHRSHSGNSFCEMLPVSSTASSASIFFRRSVVVVSFFAVAFLSCFVFFRAASTAGFRILRSPGPSHPLSYVFPSVAENDTAEAYFMTPDYLKMMWRRIDFLRSVLEMGYNFVFTDADVMWFRDPFPWFHSDADFQIACDHFVGNFDDLQNRPNGGFNYVRSNNRSIEFYKFWYSSREVYPGYHDQDVLNMIKFDAFIMDIELKIRFLSTAQFGGFCEPSRDLNQVCTMHANCCVGLVSKLHDLRILLEDWKRFLSLPPGLKRSSILSWRVPQKCSIERIHPRQNATSKSIAPAKED